MILSFDVSANPKTQVSRARARLLVPASPPYRYSNLTRKQLQQPPDRHERCFHKPRFEGKGAWDLSLEP